MQEIVQCFFLQLEKQPPIRQLKQFIPKTIDILPPSQAQKEVLRTQENVSTQSSLLPKAPTVEQTPLWEDAPQDHFSLPSICTHRSQLRSAHDLNERTYYRWLKELRLNRSLPAEGNARVVLFYPLDVEQALAL